MWLLCLAFSCGLEAHALTLTHIEDKIRGGLGSIESLLEWVSTEDPQFLEQFTLMRRSVSLQGASGKFPRAIVFGRDAKLILTFNGDRSQRGYHRIELIALKETNDETAWEFREITAIPEAGRLLTISDANPARCMQCHTTSLHPIWDDYAVWKDAFGSHDDVILRVSAEDREKWTTSPGMQDRVRESDEFTLFQGLQVTHDRYQWLRPSKDSDVGPYNRQLFNPNPDIRPNLKLTANLSQHHGRTIVSQIKGKRCFPKHQYAVLAGMLNCDGGGGLPDVYSRLHELSVETDDFNLKMNPSSEHFYEGSYYLYQRVLASLYKLTAAEDKSLLSFKTHAGTTYYLDLEGTPPPMEMTNVEETVCEHLVAKAKERQNLDCAEDPIDKNVIPPTVKMCASCHEGATREKEVPLIPFSDRSQLSSPLKASILQRIASGAAQPMPPVRRLSAREKREIETYLK